MIIDHQLDQLQMQMMELQDQYLKHSQLTQTRLQMKQERQDQIVVQKLIKVAILSLLFMSVEIVGGYFAGSIAILADAFHLLSDVMAYAISLFAVLFSKKTAPEFLTFGYEKLQPLGALANVAIIWVVTVELCVQATSRIINKDVVHEPWIMLGTSFFGLGCNLVIMKILHSDPDAGHSCSHQHGHGDSHGHSHAHDHGHSHNHSESNDSKNGQLHQHLHQHGHSCSHNHSKHKKSKSKDNKKPTTMKRVLLNEQDLAANDDNSGDKMQEKDEHGQAFGNALSLADQIGQNKAASPLNEQSPINQTEILTKQDSEVSSDSGTEQHEIHLAEQSKVFQNINIQAAYIHIISDIILSIGVIISAILIVIFTHNEEDGSKNWTAWQLVDPFCTYFFSIMAIYSTIKITKDSVIILLDGCDKPTIVKHVKHEISHLHSCKQLLQLKVWTANRGKYYGIVKAISENQEKFKKDVTKIMKKRNIDCFIDVSQ